MTKISMLPSFCERRPHGHTRLVKEIKTVADSRWLSSLMDRITLLVRLEIRMVTSHAHWATRF